MLEYIICFAIGIVVAWLYFLNTNDSLPMNRNLAKEELLQQKARIAKLEQRVDSVDQIVSSHTTRMIEGRQELAKVVQTVSKYEGSFDQIHKDYIGVHAEIAAIDRRYAALTPVHIHYQKDLPKMEKKNESKRRAHQINV